MTRAALKHSTFMTVAVAISKLYFKSAASCLATMAASSAPAITGRYLGGSTATTRHAGRGSGVCERGRG